MKFRLILSISVLMTGGTLFAQDSFEEWKKAQEEEFSNFVAEEDQAFADFLEKEWKEFQAFKSMEFDTEPKPLYAPRVSAAPTKHTLEKSSYIEEQSVPLPGRKSVTFQSGPFHDTRSVSDGFDRINFNFLGMDLSISDPGKPEVEIDGSLSNQVFSDAWLGFSEWNHQSVIDESLSLRDDYGLNDWGYYLLLHSISDTVYPGDSPEKDILTWYLMVKSGFDCRVGYSSNDVYLLIPSVDRMYDVLYFYFNQAGPYYYFFTDGAPSRGVSQFYTYTGSAPQQGTSITMRLDRVPRLVTGTNNRDFFFMYQGKTYKLSVNIDPNIINFGQNFPQTDLDVYFSSPVSADTRHSLVNGMKLLVEDKTETEAANMILRFVQTAFDYQTDQQQFGIEKPMFVEEALYYPYCDCEDRSVLYSYLVREVLDLDVIGLDYPGHIATAVAFSKPVSGDSVSYNGRRYVICDPTYINADIGMAMPRYRGQQPGIIETGIR